MALEIKVPSPGESISEAEIGTWFVEDGDFVEKDQEIGELESEKATLPVIAEESGKIRILKNAGETVKVGEVICTIDPSQKGEKKENKTKEPPSKEAKKEAIKDENPDKDSSQRKEEKDPDKSAEEKKPEKEDTSKVKTTPVARKMMEDNKLDIEDIIKGLKKISSREVGAVLGNGTPGSTFTQQDSASRDEMRSKMSSLRRKISERLVAVKNQTAMLTTFNEADMSAIIGLRQKYQKSFVEKHEVKLGFMSFFAKAVTLALKQFPNVNSRIEEDEVITPDYCDIGIAVQTDKGLMVPVIRNVETLSLPDIEKQILELAGKARKNRISIEEMSGGTFTITNGGIFGSMLSTPIINPPQSAILGMHNIQERPVAINGKVEIRPMMYLALSYDHRIIDGRDSVSFLVKVKELLEDPTLLLLGGNDPANLLLDL